MRLELPFPPSTNSAYANVRGRRVKTKRAREYAKLVEVLTATHKEARVWRGMANDSAFPPRLNVQLEAYPPDRRRRDLANLEKLAIDAVFNYLGLDDSLIDDLHLIRRDVEKPGRLVMTITEANA